MAGFLGLLAQGRSAARDKNRAEKFQDLLFQQKQDQAGLQSRLMQSQIGENEAQTDAIRNPKPKIEYRDTDDGIVAIGPDGKATPLLRADGTPIKSPKKAPLPGTPEWKQAEIDAAKIKAQYAPQDKTLVQVQQPDGTVVYTPRSQAAGLHAPTKGSEIKNLPAPMAAKVGQAGEMIKKAADLLPRMETLDVSLGQSAAQDQATHGVGAFGIHIPGTQGIGAAIVSRTPEYATYQAALTPFVLAAAHAIGGARINDTQIAQIRASIEIKPGESAESRKQKFKNLTDLVNSISGSLPPDAIAAQEGQMEPNRLAILRGYGYKSAGSPPAHDKPGDIDLGQPSKPQTPKNQGHPTSAKPKADADAILAKYGIK